MTKKETSMTSKEINQMILALKVAFVGSGSVGLFALVLADYQTALYGIFIALAAIAANKQLIKER